DTGAGTRERVEAALVKVQEKFFKGGGYVALRDDHVAAHRKLFNRVKLRIGSPQPPKGGAALNSGPTVSDAASSVPTRASEQSIEGRLEKLRAGKADPALEALYFHYGRYLLMSCSAPGGLPANLQG